MRFCPTLPIEDPTSGWVSLKRSVGIDLLWKSFIWNDIMLKRGLNRPKDLRFEFWNIFILLFTIV